ncbi:zeatin O-glucosyltransferase-like protein [Tanacetum coccineum]
MDHHDDDPTKVVPVVVMVPFISHGHLNQLIHLSNIVSKYNIPVHLVCTATSLAQARTRLDSVLATNHMINFHEFTTPPFASPPPDPSIAFPAHQQSSFESTLHLRHPVGDLVTLLSKTAARVVVIHDTLMSYVVQDVVSIPNVETYNFRPLSAFYYFWDFWDKLGRPFEVDDMNMIYNKLPSKDGIVTPEFKAFARLQYPHMDNVVGDLYDSSRVIEGEYIDYLERQEISGKKKIWAIGPINHVQIESDVMNNRHHCLRWLDEQSKNSIIYVSFGTTTTFSKDQIRELAIGLEKSGKRFIWVVRAADVGDAVGFQDGLVELPDGFEERVKGRGLIERGWAPQSEILGHFATGGFMTHCGWNSCMESMSMGVPMATWPMHSDQPRNAVLITQVLGIGVVVKDWEHRDELVRDVVVKEAVEKLMDSKEGDEMRKSAVMLGDSIKKSMMEGGVSRLEMDSFVSYITR